jgi:stage III sporulation protein SpoIIIAA
MFKRITDDLDALMERLPPGIAQPLMQREDRSELLEVVLDLGRLPEARFPTAEVVLSEQEVSREDIEHVISRIGVFSGDNRAGIERTLHRISAIRNREGRIVGLTLRVGRAVYGTINIIEDLIKSGKSILLLGRPGVGKTTMLREVARVFADELKKRAVVVDTSNEIAGDGDIPHPAIGHARRMQVPTPQLQHAVMIEAVENHMPEVIIIDEIGTELEARAARTIAERGVQLVATAHGNTLENLIMNPTLSDLIGGIQTVTLGDEEARRRGTQKSILERKAPPTFDILVEIQDWERVAVHSDVAGVVDALLRGRSIHPEVRWLDETAEVRREQVAPAKGAMGELAGIAKKTRIYPLGINRSRLDQVAKKMELPVKVVDEVTNASLLMTSKSVYRRKPQPLHDAEAAGIPIYVLKSSRISQMERALANIFDVETSTEPFGVAIEEAERAIAQVMEGRDSVELNPPNASIRLLQHQLAQRYNLTSRSTGREPRRRVRIFRTGEG